MYKNCVFGFLSVICSKWLSFHPYLNWFKVIEAAEDIDEEVFTVAVVGDLWIYVIYLVHGCPVRHICW